MATPASLHYNCPKCGRSFILAVADSSPGEAAKSPPLESPPFFECDSCGFEITFNSSLPDPGACVDQCALCGNRDFYVQKDFNRTLGIWIVLASAMVAFLVMVLSGDHRKGIAVLAFVTLLDLIIYRRLGDVTVCYLCHTIYRKYPLNSTHKPFYLGSEEHFKKLRQEWIQGIRK